MYRDLISCPRGKQRLSAELHRTFFIMRGLSVVIVGGGAGLGALIAEMAVASGATALGIIDLNAEAAEAALAPARIAGLPAAFASCDIRYGEKAKSAFNDVAAALGRVDTLVNSAAIFPRKPLLEITDNDWDALNGVNVKGTYHMAGGPKNTYMMGENIIVSGGYIYA